VSKFKYKVLQPIIWKNLFRIQIKKIILNTSQMTNKIKKLVKSKLLKELILFNRLFQILCLKNILNKKVILMNLLRTQQNLLPHPKVNDI
jgi:hypothetical protein